MNESETRLFCSVDYDCIQDMTDNIDEHINQYLPTHTLIPPVMCIDTGKSGEVQILIIFLPK